MFSNGQIPFLIKWFGKYFLYFISILKELIYFKQQNQHFKQLKYISSQKTYTELIKHFTLIRDIRGNVLKIMSHNRMFLDFYDIQTEILDIDHISQILYRSQIKLQEVNIIGYLLFPLDVIIKDILVSNIYGSLGHYKFISIIIEEPCRCGSVG